MVKCLLQLILDEAPFQQPDQGSVVSLVVQIVPQSRVGQGTTANLYVSNVLLLKTLFLSAFLVPNKV